MQNDRVDLAAIEAITITHIVISPGPGGPSEAGASEDVIIDLLDGCRSSVCVCAIRQSSRCMEGTVAVCGEIMHGKTSAIHHDALGVFREILDQFQPCSIPLSCRNCRHTLVVSDRHSEDVEWTDHGCTLQVVSCRGGSSFILRASSPSTATSSCTTLLSTTAS